MINLIFFKYDLFNKKLKASKKRYGFSSIEELYKQFSPSHVEETNRLI